MPRFFKNAREPISSYTHFWGALGSALGLVLLLMKAPFSADCTPVRLASLLTFGLSLVLLYSASSVYHFSRGGDARVERLRKLDHSMIYVLIAGTYTPILLHYLPAPKSWYAVGFMWGLCVLGVTLKLFWMRMPRQLSSAFYIGMGWAILIDLPSLSAMGSGELLLLVGGGVVYTAGGVIYALKKPNFSPAFGFHEFFHLFCLGGSLLHFLMIFFYIA